MTDKPKMPLERGYMEEAEAERINKDFEMADWALVEIETALKKKQYLLPEWYEFKKQLGLEPDEPIQTRNTDLKRLNELLKGLERAIKESPLAVYPVYAALLHGPGLDEIAKLDRKTEIQKNPITGTAYATVGNMTIQHKQGINVGPPAKQKASRKELTKEDEALLFQRYISTAATTAALKLLDISAIKLTEQNGYGASKFNTNVEMDVAEYMEKCGIPLTTASTKKTKSTLKGILEAFNAITLDFQEKRAGRDGENWHLNILQKYEDNMASGKIKLQFTEDIAEYLTGAFLAHFPMPLLKTDERNDNVYRMGRRLMLHYSNVYNQEKGTADIISVKALLESAPSIRTYEEVMAAKGDRHLEVSIMRPFKTALDKLDFIEWEYCNAKKAHLTKKQKAEFDYHTFIVCYVKFTVLNGPDMKKIVAAKQEKKAQAEAKKKARAEARKKADA